MTETKQCSKCKVFRQLNQIEENNKNCNVCLEQRRRYRQRHKEEINIQSKAYREKNREELNMKQNEKAECSIYVNVWYEDTQWTDINNLTNINTI